MTNAWLDLTSSDDKYFFIVSISLHITRVCEIAALSLKVQTSQDSNPTGSPQFQKRLFRYFMVRHTKHHPMHHTYVSHHAVACTTDATLPMSLHLSRHASHQHSSSSKSAYSTFQNFNRPLKGSFREERILILDELDKRKTFLKFRVGSLFLKTAVPQNFKMGSLPGSASQRNAAAVLTTQTFVTSILAT